MIRRTLAAAARGVSLALTRGTLTRANDKPKLQEVDVRGLFKEQFTGIEHWLPYGVSFVPLPPDKDGAAEVLIGFLGGSRSHPVALAIADRRHRPKDMKPGDIAHHDHRKQIVIFTKDGIAQRSPIKLTHETVDGDGNVTSSVVQEPSGKVTISNKHGASVVMDGANLQFKAGQGGSHSFDGDMSVKGKVDASETVTGTAGVISAGLPVRTA